MRKIVAWPPFFVTWAEGLSTETVGEDFVLAKNRSEDFFFWSSPNFGQKNGLGFGLKNFHSGLNQSQIFCPSFENPAYATVNSTYDISSHILSDIVPVLFMQWTISLNHKQQ